MGEKSIQKRNYIIETARKVFIQKGFKNVTMKDIVEACDISRGGLYIYFDSTESVFNEVLKEEMSRADSDLESSIPNAVTNSDILTLFFRQQKKDILQTKDSLLIAMYEYCFETKAMDTKSITDKQVENGTAFLERLLKAGNATGEFAVKNPKRTARNMIYAFEGLKVLNRTGNITEKTIDDELVHLLEGILPAK